MKSLMYLLVFGVVTNGILAQTHFAREAVIQDLDYLKNSLEKTHFNLYAFTSKEEFDNHYKAIRASVLQDSISEKEVIALLQQVMAKANTGHAEVNFPVVAYRTYAGDNGLIFPIEVAIEDGRALIRKNFSSDQELTIGLELLAVDGVPIQDLLERIYPHLSAETTYFKNAKVEFLSFPRLYWQVFGPKATFDITINKNGKSVTVTIDAVDLIEGYEMKRTNISNTERFYKFYQNTAYLKPGNFSGDETVFKSFIDSAFAEIKTQKSDKLILDLRNNQGGHNAFSDYMVSYFATTPFKWHSKFMLKSSSILKEQTRLNSDTTDQYFKEILERADDEVYEYRYDAYLPQDISKQFRGAVYVLINRHSYSMAAVTAAMIQDYKFGKLVGEETGDHPSLHASQFQYPLPNTGIPVKVPKGYMIRPNGQETKRGVIPDIFIKDHLVDEEDEILKGLLSRLEEK